MKWEKIRTKVIFGNGRFGFVLPLLVLVWCLYDLKLYFIDGVSAGYLEALSDPIFYLIVPAGILFVLVIMFVLSKIFPKPKS